MGNTPNRPMVTIALSECATRTTAERTANVGPIDTELIRAGIYELVDVIRDRNMMPEILQENDRVKLRDVEFTVAELIGAIQVAIFNKEVEWYIDRTVQKAIKAIIKAK